MKKTNEKERNWTCVVYPESVKEDWKETLQSYGLQVAISPLHNKDIDPTGENKKPHYHILIHFNGPTTYRKVAILTEEIGATIPQRVISAKGMIRYFTHKDNPEKYQYDEKEITTINGLDINEIDGFSNSEIEEIKRQLVGIINELQIHEYADLYDYCKNNELYEMCEIISKNTIFFNAYLKSKLFTAKRKTQLTTEIDYSIM